MIQGEALKRIRGFVYRKKYDQRELIKVAQRQFRKYMQMRDWGWFVIIQKTRGLIGLPNPAEELALLEAKAGGQNYHLLVSFCKLEAILTKIVNQEQTFLRRCNLGQVRRTTEDKGPPA